jgi:inosine-uridine nucleoside N-ribohydrolase
MELALISVTYGNVTLKRCLKNVVSLFHVLDKELSWRKANGKPEGFAALKAYKPTVAIGAEHALEEENLREDECDEINEDSRIDPRRVVSCALRIGQDDHGS